MVKRFSCISLMIVLLFGCCSCGKEVSEYAFEHGQISLEIVEDYLNGDISDDVAMTKLKTQQTLIQEYCDKVEADTGKHPYRDSIVAIKIGSCYTAVFSHHLGSSSKEKIKDAAKDLKKAMNK